MKNIERSIKTEPAIISFNKAGEEVLRFDVYLINEQEQHFDVINQSQGLLDERPILVAFRHQHIPTLVTCKVQEVLDFIQIIEDASGKIWVEKKGTFCPTPHEGNFIVAFQCKYLMVAKTGTFASFEKFVLNDLSIQLS